MTPLLRMEGLSVRISGRPLVDGVSLTVAPGECLALVGESGAGKTLTARSALGLTPTGATVSAERLEIDGMDVLGHSAAQWRHLRGARVALVNQDALVALDPLRRVGREVAEPIEVHRPHRGGGRSPGRGTRALVTELLRRVAIPDPAQRERQYPHELSGGLRQRALIASALAAGPGLLVADEPTTALDATVQRRILDLLAGLKAEGLGLLLVSHDLASVAAVADRVAVMCDGRIVETGPSVRVLGSPREHYTRELLAATPRARAPRSPGGVPVLVGEGLVREYRTPTGRRRALDGVDLRVAAGRTVGIVGESGSGKSTLARLLLGLERPDSGRVELLGQAWSELPERRRRRRRGSIQLIDQDAFGALESRWRVDRILGEALAARDVGRSQRRDRAVELLESVGLAEEHLRRRPGELSGGQRQRVCIARALAGEPAVLVCDEPVSALDATVQARVLDLLDDVQRRTGVAIVLVSHDLAVVARMADDVLVLLDGAVVEAGPAGRVLAAPQHPFTRALVDSAPSSP